jgi:hypothetical protein
MKAKIDIHALKANHRIELVLQEAGERFEIEPADPSLWRSLTTYGLTVNLNDQTYERKRPGMDTETGDVIAWLKRRYAWQFPMAIRFLQGRMPDPKQEMQPLKIAQTEKKNIPGDWKIISHSCTDPMTGLTSCAWSYNEDRMDIFQRQAVSIMGDWILKYFSMSSHQLAQELEVVPHRFKQIIDFEIEECSSCKKAFNWQAAEVVAYAQEQPQILEVVSDTQDTDIYIDQEIILDAGFVVCEKCMRHKYLPRYQALRLAGMSARKREKAEREERERQDHEVQVQEEHDRERLANGFIP